jgi:hypothetical protein
MQAAAPSHELFIISTCDYPPSFWPAALGLLLLAVITGQSLPALASPRPISLFRIPIEESA